MNVWRPETYEESRKRFLQNCSELSLSIETFEHPERGPEGEALFIDVAIHKSAKSQHGIFHLIGTHGIEAYAGSSIQNLIFENLKNKDQTSWPNLLFVHPVNPYGMAWWRRTNHSNVDLNRNYRNRTFEAPDESIYQKLDRFLNPKTKAQFLLGWMDLLKVYVSDGYSGIKQGIAQGQYAFDKGLFYGGKDTEPEIQFLKKVFSDWSAQLQEVWGIEVHTGLGEWTKDFMLAYLTSADSAEAQRMAEVYGQPMDIGGDDKETYKMHGQMCEAFFEVSGAKLYYVIEEFGTYPHRPMLLAGRNENYFHHHAGAPSDRSSSAKKAFREVFYPESEEWMQAVAQTGLERFKAVFAALQK